MTSIKRNLKVLSQFSLKESFLIIIGLFLKVLLNKVPKNYMEKKGYFDLLILEGVEVNKENHLNKLSNLNDNEIGPYSIYIRRFSSDLDVYDQVIRRRQYGSITALVNKYHYGTSVKYIIDAGANIGLATLYLKKKFPNSKIISVEPDEDNFSLLKRNVSLNNLHNVFCLKAALWGKAERLEIDKGFRDNREWSRSVRPCVNKNVSFVDGTTISEIMLRYDMPRADILKVDIEGSEREVFDNDTDVNEFLGKVKFIAIEIHDECSVRGNILNQLKLNDFEYFHDNELTVAVNKKLLDNYTEIS